MSRLDTDPKAHWDRVYSITPSNAVSWFQQQASTTMELLRSAGATPATRIIDVGGGASCLPRELLDAGFQKVTVLDISTQALEQAKQALGSRARLIEWIRGDVRCADVGGPYDIWHDRAVLHFLVDPVDRTRYRDVLLGAVAPNGQVIIGAFALDGPLQCSGLPVVRYDPDSIMELFGRQFTLVETLREDHRTPGGAVQRFAWFRLRRRSAGAEQS